MNISYTSSYYSFSIFMTGRDKRFPFMFFLILSKTGLKKLIRNFLYVLVLYTVKKTNLCYIHIWIALYNCFLLIYVKIWFRNLNYLWWPYVIYIPLESSDQELSSGMRNNSNRAKTQKGTFCLSGSYFHVWKILKLYVHTNPRRELTYRWSAVLFTWVT